MHSAQVVMVEWGALTDPTFTDPANGDPGFFKYLASQSGSTTDIGAVLAGYGDNLGPGGATQNSANVVSYGGEYEITPAEGDGSVPATVTDAQIQTELQTAITDQALPAPLDAGLGTVYVIIFPQTDTIEGPGGIGVSGIDFCAYHDTAGTAADPLIYAVIPDNGSGTSSLFASGQDCGGAPTTLDSETFALSHEFSESVNDPERGLTTVTPAAAPAAWFDDSHGEIGDICDMPNPVGGVFTIYASGWLVQNLWSNRDSSCRAAEPSFSAPTVGKITPAGVIVAGRPVGFSTTGTSDAPQDSLTVGTVLGPGIASYSWNWGDGTPLSSGAAPHHVYAQPGKHTVAVTVTDDLGFTKTGSTHIVVYSGIPEVTTGTPARSISGTSALLPGTIDPNGATTTYQFIYGRSPSALNRSSTVTAAGAGSTVEAVNASISNLTRNTTYYFELIGTANRTAYKGHVQQFTTTSAPPFPPQPVLSTGAASNVTSGGASLNGTVNADGLTVTHRFAWGTSVSSLTHLTPSVAGPAGRSAVPVQASLSGLAAGKTYYFQVRATRGGQTRMGRVVSFRTPSLSSVTSVGFAQLKARPLPKLDFVVRGRPSALGAIRLTFTCDEACSTAFAVTPRLTGRDAAAADPVALANWTGRLRHAGTATITLRPTDAGAAVQPWTHGLRVAVRGVAWSQPGLSRAPVVRALTLG